MSVTAVLEPPSTIATPPVLETVPASQPATLPKMTVQEYFEFERKQEIRYEYVEGDLIAMPGTSFEHNQIALNISSYINRAFEENDCRVFMEAIRLRVSLNKYRYPDVMAVCETPVTDGEKPPALLNPALAVEVLSDSTEAIDKGEKFFEYQSVPSLTDYVLVSQDTMQVIHCAKQNNSQWLLTTYTALTDTLTFASLGVTISLADIYRKIKFDATNGATP